MAPPRVPSTGGEEDAPMATSTILAMIWDEWQQHDATARALCGSGTMRNEKPIRRI
jgi:hypothetical protein